MAIRLTKIGDDLALILDPKLLAEVGIDTDTPLEISAEGSVIVVAPASNDGLTPELRKLLEEMNKRYSGAFRRLADS